MKLHPTQEKLLALLSENITSPLTIRELQDELNLSTPSLVHHHIQQLEKKGYLRRNPTNPQDYQVVTSADSPEKLIAYINMYGMAQCGPNGTILSGDPMDRVPLSTKILGFRSEDAFIVKARGNSMMPRINEGDLIIAKKASDAPNGSLVVCVNNGEALIKKIQKMNDSILLVSLNPSFEPFIASKDDFRIEGTVKCVMSYKI
jgi:repressor LexA